jgi:hypothetical protein
MEEEVSKTCSTQEVTRNAYNILTGYPEGKRKLGSSKNGWEVEIKMSLKAKECENY